MADVTNNMVHGVAPVLQSLRQLEPELYKMIVADLKNSTNDLRLAVANDFPDKPWKSTTGKINWVKYGRTSRGRKMNNTAGADFPRWNAAKVKRGVQVKVGGRKVRRTDSYPILRIVQSDAAGSIWDLAKTQRGDGKVGEKFVKNLNATGSPSRVMWKSVPKYYPLVERKVDKILDDIGKRFTVQIANETAKRNKQSMQAASQTRNALGRFGKAL
jgi:hypothetical protein